MNELRAELLAVIQAVFEQADGRPLESLDALADRVADAVMTVLDTNESGVTAVWWLSQLSREVELLSRRNAVLLVELGKAQSGSVS